MSKFRTLVEEESKYYFGPERSKYILIYTAGWSGPWGDDKDVEELNAGDDLEKAKEKCKDLSIKLNKLVDVYEYESNTFIARYINGVETDQSNQPINKE